MWRLIESLFALAAEKFWGDVLITFKEGRILHVRVTQQYTEQSLPRATDAQRKGMTQPDRELLALMAAEEQKPPARVPMVAMVSKGPGSAGWVG